VTPSVPAPLAGGSRVLEATDRYGRTPRSFIQPPPSLRPVSPFIVVSTESQKKKGEKRRRRRRWRRREGKLLERDCFPKPWIRPPRWLLAPEKRGARLVAGRASGGGLLLVAAAASLVLLLARPPRVSAPAVQPARRPQGRAFSLPVSRHLHC